ncbi:FAD-dependent oxidoreductase [Massilia sp. Dwa41.01b]|uniref:FAD-dependent monooxygenase n=1 Tax=unclassified Massilia TaxID=2609279 RepID=UPI0015FEE089|nr:MULTISPECIES: FAD-dependent monooxygenase [unclassified Massilia]QNA87319.1 FAD-dependent oxidoreductase [Massilia sp. Dwa41.01b]QNA98226.1 FAD-dependent oxidoreductase [Massilia sp. Se16.2.3]
MAHEQVDVLINGGGIAGATLAYLLGRQGRRVLLVEHADRGRMLSGADLLKPAGIRVIENMGLLDEVAAIGGRRRELLRVFHDREPLCTVDYRANDELGYFILIPCERLRNLVLEQMTRFESIECLFNTRIASVASRADGGVATVTLDNGHTVAPTVMVGADGFASYTRRLLAITTERTVYPAPMCFGTTRLVPSVEECNRLYVDSRHGLAYFYPVSASEGRVVVSFPKEEMRELMADRSGALLRARLRHFVGEASADAVDEVTDTGIFKGIPIGRINLDTYHRHNVAMLGDAIHNVHPITGQGMNLAIEDAGELAQQLGLALSGMLPLTEALDAYQRRRHGVNEAVVTYGHSLVSSFADKASFAACFNGALQGSSRQSAHLRPVAVA